MGKYAPLGDFLRSQGTREVPLTFAEIERITGVKLPPKAQHHRAWWSNKSNNVITKVWLEAGYETSQLDMSTRRLVFRRVRKARAGEPLPSQPPAPAVKPGERHPLRGALKGLTRIPPGVDLTEPADPEWADLLDDDDHRS